MGEARRHENNRAVDHAPTTAAGPPDGRAAGTLLSRRRLLIGGAVAAIEGAGVRAEGEGEPSVPPAGGSSPASPERPVVPTPVMPSAHPPLMLRRRTPPRSVSPVRDALRRGYALVTSPRLPLMGVGPTDPDRLMTGGVSDWGWLGSPVPLPVDVVALADAAPRSLPATARFATYDALTAALRRRPGAVALVPLELVDVRVQVLLVGGIDPLTSGDRIAPAARIGVVGDIVPGRNVHQYMVRYGDFGRPFRRVASLLRRFDLTVANLEGNLSDTLPQPADPHSVTFVSSPAMLDGFALAGIDAVTLANNHTVWNGEGWGVQGLLDTMAALEVAGLPYFGAGSDLAGARAPWVTEVAGERLAWLGIDGVTANVEVPAGPENGVVGFEAGAGPDQPGTNPYVSAQFLADIAAAADGGNAVIPYFHMGVEYVAVPPPWAVAGARAAIEAGAAMVVTNHPHIIQGMELYQGKPIVYSPGNFVMDQMFAVEVRSGYALEILLRAGAVVGVRVHGVEIEEFHQPRLMSAGEQANLLDRFWRSADRLAREEGEPAAP